MILTEFKYAALASIYNVFDDFYGREGDELFQDLNIVKQKIIDNKGLSKDEIFKVIAALENVGTEKYTAISLALIIKFGKHV